MAIILLGSTKCSICGQVLNESDEIYATSAFLRPEHSLWRYSDSGMHWDCFDEWEHQTEFVAELITVVTDCDKRWGWGKAFAGKHCSVLLSVAQADSASERSLTCSRARLRDNPTVVIWLHDAGTSFRTTLNDWAVWLKDEPASNSFLLQRSWNNALQELKTLTPESLLSVVDTDAVIEAWNARAAEEAVRSQQEKSARTARLNRRNRELHDVLQDQPDCPHCGTGFESLKYYDNRTNGRLSCVICQECARSSRIEEFNGDIAFRGGAPNRQ